MQLGDCVQIPDGRIGRIRDITSSKVKVRVMRSTSKTHQFLFFPKSQLQVVACPRGWMSRDGYNNYLKITLEKMKKRLKK